MNEDQPVVLHSRHWHDGRLFEITPRLYRDPKAKTQCLKLASGKLVHCVPWVGDAPKYAVLIEAERVDGPRQLFSLYCPTDLELSELEAIHRTLQKQTYRELSIVMTDLVSIEELGFALLATRVLMGPSVLKNGSALHCTYNRTLTQAKALFLSKDKDGLLRAYPNTYSLMNESQRLNAVGRKLDPKSPTITLAELFKYAQNQQ